ncbi:MAG: hypothetical protein PHO02_02910 [Candidatus Nanoarchaeia archaeon]|nr:hypothetical protein [Candidatus Nanoarchaeia archaeon]
MDLISEVKQEWGKKDGGIDLDNPLVIAFRRANLETLAKEQNTNLYCPYCEAHLPHTMATLGGQVPTGKRDAYGQKEYRSALYCPLCERYFDKEPEQLKLF